MKYVKNTILLFIFFNLLLIGCSSEKPVEVVDYKTEETKEKKELTLQDSESKEFLEFVKGLEKSTTSFSAKFQMKIQSGESLKQIDKLDGEMFFDKDTGKVKIQLADPIFGFVVTRVVSDDKNIQLKMAGVNGIHTQPMGDLKIQDPKTKKTHVIPFPVIYISITRKFIDEFRKGNTTIDLKNRIVTVKKEEEEYRYKFSETNLQNLELFSKPKNIKAVASVIERNAKFKHPPKKLGTRVTRMSDNIDTNRFEIVYSSIKRKKRIPPNVFVLQ